MSMLSVWLILAGVLLGSEMLSGTFYLLMLGVGALAGALCAQIGLGFTAQALIAAVVGLGACLAVWQYRGKRVTHAKDDGVNPMGHFDIGERVHVVNWNADGTCEVKHRGAMWGAIALNASVPLHSGVHTIVALDGTRLVISPVQVRSAES